MAHDARAYRNTLLTLWLVLPAIAYWYSTQQNISPRIAIWFVAAALVELAFYLAQGFTWSRGLIESIEPAPVRAFVLMLTAIAPYCIYALGTGTFHWRSFTLLAVLATVAASWYAIQSSPSLLSDLLFIALFAGVWLSRIFGDIYITLAPHATAAVLGQSMWIRLCILSVLTIRRMGGIGLGFWPASRDWIYGLLGFAAFAPVAWFAGTLIHFAQPRSIAMPWWRVALIAAATFAGILWWVALFEEFFARGMLQQILSKRWGKIAGLVGASMLFGLTHLPFHQFPNWRFAILASLAGLFYGIVYLRAGNIRASMVTHALVVTTWRVFFV